MMKRKFLKALMFTFFFTVTLRAQPTTTGWVSSYWDGCKPTCSWYQNLSPASMYGLSRSCGLDNAELPLGDIAEAKCAKDGGPAFSCWDQIPFADPDSPNLAYGFGATAQAVCGQCFEVTFTGEYEHGSPMPMHNAIAGKKAIVMGRNTGGVAGNQIDFLVPGGGLGDFDCFSRQIGLPDRSEKLGKMYGGLLGNCIDAAIGQFAGNWNAPGVLEWVQACHLRGCEEVFSEYPLLMEGCRFHVEWMHSAPNPKASVRVLDECPQILVDRYVPKSSKYTIITKSVTFTSSTGDVSINTGNQTTSGINSSTTLTYNNVNVTIAGEYTMEFTIATQEATTITVTVNGQPAGTLSNVKTASWGTFEKVTLGNKVTLAEGSNTVVLSFQTNSVNFDYFMFTGDEEVIKKATEGGTSIRHTLRRAAPAGVKVKLIPFSGGFTATLPADHGYTSYKLIDLRGREIRKGKISDGTRELRLGNLSKGVIFLRLEGGGSFPVALRATAF
ncbi:MAG: carbohydrate-binding protein [Chitinispirillales bacterium]|jgi:hypothetical protein|nr:carbohydrate-binding protein [Chitinispirillales bacterium]